MSDLITGNGWKTVRFGEVAKTSSGGTPKRGTSSYYGGDIPWVKSGELGDSVVYETQETISEMGLKNSSAKLFPKGTLCVALYGATVGKLGILGIDAATNQAVCGIFLPDEIDTGFAYRFLESKRRELVNMAKGGAQPNISQEIIRNLEFPLPPLDEQRRIVAEIEKQFTRLDAGVAALKRMQANLKRYRAAVLKAACEGHLVPTEAELAKAKVEAASRRLSSKTTKSRDGSSTYEPAKVLLQRILTERREKWNGRGKYKEPAAPDVANLPELPEGWVWAKIEQLMFLLRNGISTKPDATEGLPILRISAVRPLSVDMKEIRFLEANAKDLYSYILNEGDLLFTRYNGNPDYVGVCGAVPAQSSPLVYPDKLIRCKLISKMVHPRFVAIMANAGASRAYMSKRIRTTAGQSGISGTDVKGLPIPLPPFAEQERIVAEVERRLSMVDELEATVIANLQRAMRLRQSILQQAFSGGI